MSNKIFLAGVTALLLSGSVVAETVDSSSSTWIGQYIGFTGGYSRGAADPTANAKANGYFITTDPGQLDPVASHDIKAGNVSGTVFWGVNRQLDNILYGVEIDLYLTDYNERYRSGNITYLTQPAHTFEINSRVKSNIALSLRPRLGYITGDSLFYLSLGPVLRHFEYNFKFTDTFASEYADKSDEQWSLGWAAGLGFEQQLKGAWSLKVEYLHSSYDDIVDIESSLRTVPADGFKHSLEFKEQSFRVGFYRRF